MPLGPQRYRRRMRLQAVVFDLDGVIIDGTWALNAGWHGVFGWYCGYEGIRAFDQTGGARVATQDELLLMLSDLALRECNRETVLRDYHLAVATAGWETPPIPGALELIAALRDANVRVAVASNTQRWWVDHHLWRNGIAAAFDVIATGDEEGLQQKPAPDLYSAAIERLDVRPDHVVAIEDSVTAVDAAVAAGISGIVYLRAPWAQPVTIGRSVRSLLELTVADLEGLVGPTSQ